MMVLLYSREYKNKTQRSFLQEPLIVKHKSISPKADACNTTQYLLLTQ